MALKYLVTADAKTDLGATPAVLQNALASTTLTISSGAVTPTRAAHVIAAESGTSDDLATVTTTNFKVGDRITIVADSGDTITLKHGTGNITTDTGADIVLDAVTKYTTLYVTASGVVASLGGSSGVYTKPAANTQAALVAAIATGAVELAPNTTYQISSALVIPAGCHIRGPRSAVIQWATADSGSSFTMFDIQTDNVTLEGFTIDGNNDVDTYAGGFVNDQIAVYARGTSGDRTANLRLYNLAIKNCGEYLILGQFLDGADVIGCDMERAGFGGIIFESSNRVFIFDNDIARIRPGDPGASYNAYGIGLTNQGGNSAYPCSDFIVLRNRVNNVTTWEAIDTHGGSNGLIAENIINNCGAGIVVQSEGANYLPSNDIQIINNNITAIASPTTWSGQTFRAWSGIVGNMGDAASIGVNLVIADNTVIGFGAHYDGSSVDGGGGIAISAVHGVQVKNNIIRASLKRGIIFSDDGTTAVTNAQVCGNIIQDVYKAEHDGSGSDTFQIVFNDRFAGLVDGNTYSGNAAPTGNSYAITAESPPSSSYGVRYGANNVNYQSVGHYTSTVRGYLRPVMDTSLIPGTATNDNAPAGALGEIISAEVLSGSLVSLTTDTSANVTSISLTAGDWDVDGLVGFLGGSSVSVSAFHGWISDTSATLPGVSASLINKPRFSDIFPSKTPGANPLIYRVPMGRLSLATTTTIYLGTRAAFASDTLGAFGNIIARRAR